MNNTGAALPQKKASRQGRYRKSLLDPQSLAPIAAAIEAVFNALDQKRSQSLLSDAEFTSYGLLTLLACRRQDAFQRHRSRQPKATHCQAETRPFTLADFWQLLGEHQLPLNHYQGLLDQNLSVYEFLNNFRFRGIPDAAQAALLKWLDKAYPLTLVFYIPSVDEVFELQKRGGRCISFVKTAADLTDLHHDRDAVSFIVHDLIHAHEFYADPQRARQQIGFYHWLDNIKHHPRLLQLLAESADFRANWEYILSDMNSYCGHLLKTLHAAFAIHARSDSDKWLWNELVDFSDLAAAEKILFRKINSTAWSEADFLQLETALENRSTLFLHD